MDAPSELEQFSKRHLRFGWWCLLFFLTIGMGLEIFHGLKVGWYLKVSNETRRLVWTLAHAHGAMLALVQIAFAFSVLKTPDWTPGRRRFAGTCLMAATLAIPTGFFLGGLVIYNGDPGLGIILVPVGATLLFIGVLMTALAFSRTRTRPD